VGLAGLVFLVGASLIEVFKSACWRRGDRGRSIGVRGLFAMPEWNARGVASVAKRWLFVTMSSFRQRQAHGRLYRSVIAAGEIRTRKRLEISRMAGDQSSQGWGNCGDDRMHCRGSYVKSATIQMHPGRSVPIHDRKRNPGVMTELKDR
jgi:hypothetical protein